MAERCGEDEILAEMAVIVRHADHPEAGQVPEAAGLRLISGAFPLVARDDQETVERSAFLYDALYAGIGKRREHAAARASARG